MLAKLFYVILKAIKANVMFACVAALLVWMVSPKIWVFVFLNKFALAFWGTLVVCSFIFSILENWLSVQRVSFVNPFKDKS